MIDLGLGVIGTRCDKECLIYKHEVPAVASLHNLLIPIPQAYYALSVSNCGPNAASTAVENN